MPARNKDKAEGNTMMNLDQIEQLLDDYDTPSANPFELSRKLQDIVIATDNKLALIKNGKSD